MVIVDDHTVVRQDLREILEADGGFEIVGEAGTVGDGLRIVGETRPDVALVDVRLPGGGGVQLAREILSRYPGTHCLMVTSYSDAETEYHTLMSGAEGHVAKNAPSETILTAVRRAARGHRLVRLDLLEESASGQRIPTGTSSPQHRLSPEEEDVIDLILLGFTNREISSELGLSEKVVRNDVFRILGRLQVRTREDLLAVLADHRPAAWNRTADGPVGDGVPRVRTG